MADITKCEGVGCYRKESCYRYTAPANDLWQSYFVGSPKKMDGCSEYWPISGDESKEYEDRSRHRDGSITQEDPSGSH